MIEFAVKPFYEILEVLFKRNSVIVKQVRIIKYVKHINKRKSCK